MLKKILLYIRHHYSEIYKLFLFLVSITIIVLIFPKEAKFRYEYTQGSPWMYEDLIAPNDFPLRKSKASIGYERESLLKHAKLYFTIDAEKSEEIVTNGIAQFTILWNDRAADLQNESFEQAKSLFAQSLELIVDNGIIDRSDVVENKNPDAIVVLVRNKIAEEKLISQLYTVRTANAEFEKMISAVSPLQKPLMLKAMQKALASNTFYNEKLSKQEKNNLLSNMSTTLGAFQKGRRVISKGEIVDNEKYRILESLKYDFNLQSGKSNLGIIIGQIILVGVSMLAFVLFMIVFRADIFIDNSKIILILLLNIMQVFITSVAVGFHTDYLYIVPLLINLIIIRSFFDTRLALIVHLITVILISFIVPNSFEFVFIQLITGIIANVSIRNLQRRQQFFYTSFYIFISYTVIYIGMVLISEGSLEGLNYTNIMYLGISAALTLFAYPLIYIFEKIFGFITDVSLLEYADTNNRLLRDLAGKAPGTFQHSIMVANLAEEAIREIGGNALLVRAGAMYHDIGKMDAPLFFTENQSGSYSPHEELSFKESAKIIKDHVIRGVEKARKNKIPEQIIDFIRTHHGTKRVEYFYRMSMMDNPELPVNQIDYSYHGPIPFTKETAVVMMADAIEAASRSLKDPDEKMITSLVEKIIKSQFDDEQFSQAPITVSEINLVKKIMIKKLLNIYHIRIQYPE